MALPHGFRKNLNFNDKKVGPERRQEILDEITDNGTFLPRGVMYEDMDKAFIKFVEDELNLVLDGDKVPVLFLTLQRWSEFSKTWQHSDKYKNIKMPFITIVRQPNAQVGKNQAGLYNIPGRNTYTYMKVPTFEGGRRGIDVYKIPQPTSVDINYEVRLFCNRMRDLNKFNINIQRAFNAIQHYIRVNEHPMPLLLESIGDESNIDDFENKRFYVQPFDIRLQGYVLDENDFEIIPAINRALAMVEIEDKKLQPKLVFDNSAIDGAVSYNVIFKPNSETNFTFNTNFDISFTQILNIEGVNNIIIKVNGVEKFNGIDFVNPVVVSTGDEIYIEINKNLLATGKFTLIGNII